MKNFLLVTSIYLLFILMDVYVAKYGQGWHIKYKKIKYGLSITKINDIRIMSDENWNYETFLSDEISFKLENGSELFIKNLLGYCIKDNQVIFKIRTNDNLILNLIFNSKESVFNNNPKVQSELGLKNEVFYNIKSPPFLVKYWGYMSILFYSLLIIYVVLLLNRLIKTAGQHPSKTDKN